MSCHVTWDGGISLVGHELWLDPLIVRDQAFISHAHSDHSRRHRLALLTEETLTLLPTARRPHRARIVGLGVPTDVGRGRVTLHSAGHMLGAAQLLFECEGWRLLYTGDVKLRQGAGRSDTGVPQADVLIVETTYGRPHFRFPEPDAALEQIVLWCRRALNSRVTPVLLAHALGKAQEMMLALAPFGFRFALESRCMPFAAAYVAAGVTLPDHVELDDNPDPDRVVICPPAGKAAIRRLARYRTALVSGWALDAEFRRIFGADTAFAYSDHGDFDELIEIVERSGATQVYTVHGYTDEFARHLRRRGLRASPLRSVEQLALAL